MVPPGVSSESMTVVRVSIKGRDEGAMSSRDAAASVIDVISDGGLALVPFDVAYAFLASSLAPLERIYQLKLRRPTKACPVLVSWKHFSDVARSDPNKIDRIEKVVAAGLPVGVLAIPDWESDVVRSIPEGCMQLLISNEKLALFMNMGGMSEDLLDVADERGIRLFGSSANLSGMGNSFSLGDVPETIVEAMDVVCDIGTCKYKNPDRLSTSIVDLDSGQLTRRGISHEEIGRLLEG